MTRFDPTLGELQQSLAWHAKVTKRIQRRLAEARDYARKHGDEILLDILDGGDE